MYSSHSFFLWFTNIERLAFSQRWERSMTPLADGWYPDVCIHLEPSSRQSSCWTLLVKVFSQSDKSRTLGPVRQKTARCSALATDACDLLVIGMAKGNREKWSITVKIHLYPDDVSGNGPTMSYAKVCQGLSTHNDLVRPCRIGRDCFRR